MFDPATLGVFIPISAIVLGIGAGIVKTITQSQERRLEMRLRLQQGQSDAVTQQIAVLREEVTALRDTSTQFDVSLEQTVQRLEERLGRLETKSAIQGATPAHDEPTQRLGLR
jgi:uncharacterized coiled-coil protein SlyX